MLKECQSWPWLYRGFGIWVVRLDWCNVKQWSHLEGSRIFSKQDFLGGRSVTGFPSGLPWRVGSCCHQELGWTKPTSFILPCQGLYSLSRDVLGIAWLFLNWCLPSLVLKERWYPCTIFFSVLVHHFLALFYTCSLVPNVNPCTVACLYKGQCT